MARDDVAIATGYRVFGDESSHTRRGRFIINEEKKKEERVEFGGETMLANTITTCFRELAVVYGVYRCS